MHPAYKIIIGLLFTELCVTIKSGNPMELAFYDDPFQLENNKVNEVILSDTDNTPTRVIYYLYTRGAEKEEVITLNKDVLRKSHFDIRKDTKIIIHGYLDNKNKPMPQTIKNNYIQTADLNVVIVDWGSIAENINYFWIVKKVPEVGQYLGELIDFLISQGCQPNKFHLIGHSLGAHIAGIAGASLKRGKLARITGLDPAKPDFQHKDTTVKLDQTDANFVDIVHTCGGLLGLFEPLGHVDFYPNGGKNIQPGCHFYDFGRCSHIRSYQYFAESIIPNHVFPTQKCDSVRESVENCARSNIKMGNYINQRTRGIFIAHTNNKAPFSPIIS